MIFKTQAEKVREAKRKLIEKWPAWKRNYRLTKYSKGFDKDKKEIKESDDE